MGFRMIDIGCIEETSEDSSGRRPQIGIEYIEDEGMFDESGFPDAGTYRVALRMHPADCWAPGRGGFKRFEDALVHGLGLLQAELAFDGFTRVSV